MANWMLSPIMLERLVASWLPADAKTCSREIMGMDVEVRFETGGRQGIVFFGPDHRSQSVDSITEWFKPAVDARLHEIWAAGLKAA